MGDIMRLLFCIFPLPVGVVWRQQGTHEELSVPDAITCFRSGGQVKPGADILQQIIIVQCGNIKEHMNNVPSHFVCTVGTLQLVFHP